MARTKNPALPAVEKYSAKYWKSQLTLAEARHKEFWDRAKESINCYKAAHEFDDAKRRLNVWWYCVNTLMPAYYSSTPKAEVTLRKRVGGLEYELGAVAIERNTQYALDEHFNFDDVCYNAALQFLLTGRSILWARYDAEIEEEDVEFALLKDPATGQLLDMSGKPFEGEPDEIEEAAGGIVSGKMKIEKKDDERAFLDLVLYNDFLTSDARNESEIEWKARRAFLDREQAKKLFGDEVAESLSYDSFPSALKDDWRRDRQAYEGKAEVWEIWCKASEKVYWMQANGEKSILQEGEPPVEFEGFWPCVEINQSTDPDSIIPVSDYVHCKDQILEIERLTSRLHATVQAIRTNGVYDSTLGNEIEKLLQGDLKLIPVQNWPSYKGRGGLTNGVEYHDIGPYVSALQVLQEARQEAMGQLFETLKVSDLLRGASDATKTATANRLENAWSSLGLIVRQNQFAKFVSDAIAKVGTIIAEQFEQSTIFEVADLERMIASLLPEDPNVDPMMAIEAMKAKVIEVLRDDDKRCYRIQIASDSLVALNQEQEKRDGLEMLQTCGSFFEQMKAMIEQYPPLAAFSMELMQNMIRRYRGGKELDGIFQKALGTVAQLAQSKEEAAAQPPPPDPAMARIESDAQIAQMQAQLKAQKDQFDAQLAMQQQQFEEYKAQAEFALRQQELAIKQAEAQYKGDSVQVDYLKVQADAQSKAVQSAIQQESARLSQAIELQRLELEKVYMRLSESEKLMEEQRLQAEQQLERVRLGLDAMSRAQTAAPKIEQPKPTKRKKRGTIIKDAEGMPIAIDIEEVD